MLPSTVLTTKFTFCAETLLAVDDQIEAVIKALQEVGELDDTYM